MVLQSVGFVGEFSRAGGGAEGSFLGIALLVAQWLFEPGELVLETIDLLPLAQP
jgi:hypothetical protein